MSEQARQYGVLPLEEAKKLSGLAFLQGMLAGQYPAAPIAQTLDFNMDSVEAGRAVFVGRPQPAHHNPLGTIHGGYIATLLDSAMGCAIQTTLAVGQSYTTVELKINYLRPVLANGQPMFAEGKVIHAGRRTALAEGVLKDAEGKLYAHGTTTCLIFDV